MYVTVERWWLVAVLSRCLVDRFVVGVVIREQRGTATTAMMLRGSSYVQLDRVLFECPLTV